MKRILSLLLVLAIFLSGFSYGGVEKPNNDGEQLISIVEELITLAISDPASSGIMIEDTKNIKLGKMIIPYAFDEEEEVQLIENIEYYPVLKGKEQVIGIITKTIAEDGSSTITFGLDFAEELEDFITANKNKAVALIHNDGELYIANKSTLKKIFEVHQPNKTKNQLKLDKIKLNKLNLSELIGEVDLNISEDEIGIMSTRSKTLNVPYIAQGNLNLCWAASVAAIGAYRTGVYRTAKDVADAMNVDYNTGGTIFQSSFALTTLYNLDNQTFFFPLTFTDITFYIDRDRPIFASCSTLDNQNHHAVVIAGYSTSSQGVSLIIRDSNYSSFRYAYSSGDTFTLNYHSKGIFYYRSTIYLR